MSKPPDLPSYLFTVLTVGVSFAMDECEVAASYFQEQGALLLFKDDFHSVVAAFRLDTVVRVVRGDQLIE